MITRTASIRKYAVRISLAAALLGAIGWAVFHPRPEQSPQAGKRGGGAIPVVNATVSQGDVPIVVNALGTVTPLATVTVKTQIAGQLQQVLFTEGQTVRKGDFLAQIDPRPYQAQLNQYVGQLAKDKALLAAAEIDLRRYKVLVAQDSIATQQLDTQTSLVAQYQGAVETDKALVENARLNLAYCHIVSPLTGRVGLRQVDPGNYVQTSDSNGIVVITQLQPMTVVFTVPEDSIQPIAKRGRAGDPLPVAVFDRSGSTQLALGKLLTLDNQIDATTGTVKLKAIFDNADESLFPNQFVNTVLQLDVLHGQMTIPSAAVQRGTPGAFVYVVQDDGAVTVRAIKTGPASGDMTSVQSGLSVGETIVTDGMDKLREGSTVIVGNRDKAPKADAPKP
jgi:multidrug efflux system membrane fusion protein